MSEPVLTVRDLRVWYGTERRPGARRRRRLVRDRAPARPLGLVGESGCGKSTLGRGVLGLLPENAATARRGASTRAATWSRSSAGELRDLRGPEIGLIFQEPMTRLDPLLSIESHFLETLRAHEPDLDKDEMRKRSLETLAGDGDPADPVQAVPARVLRAGCDSGS